MGFREEGKVTRARNREWLDEGGSQPCFIDAVRDSWCKLPDCVSYPEHAPDDTCVGVSARTSKIAAGSDVEKTNPRGRAGLQDMDETEFCLCASASKEEIVPRIGRKSRKSGHHPSTNQS